MPRPSKEGGSLKGKAQILWKPQPDAHDYPAAESYLSLILQPDLVTRLVSGLKGAGIVQFKAKDLFRASALSLLGVSNSHVKRDQKKIKLRVLLSPLLLVRLDGRLIIADGYHRLCAVYAFDEDAVIPCKIV
jgi:hypothetical protein